MSQEGVFSLGIGFGFVTNKMKQMKVAARFRINCMKSQNKATIEQKDLAIAELQEQLVSDNPQLALVRCICSVEGACSSGTGAKLRAAPARSSNRLLQNRMLNSIISASISAERRLRILTAPYWRAPNRTGPRDPPPRLRG
jgi:hypothetical protein